MDITRSVIPALMSMGVCASAMAADMGYAPPPSLSHSSEEAVLIGNGWYLRGDVAVTREFPPVIASDLALAAAAKKDSGLVAGLGAGYQFNKWLRTDLTLDYRKTVRSNVRSADFACVTEVRGVDDAAGDPLGIYALLGQCHSAQRATFKRTSLLLNAYVDLGTWARITPYVGGGVGATYGQVRGSYDWFRGNDGSAYAPDLQMPGGYPVAWVTETGAPTTPPPGFTTFGPQSRARTVSRTEINFTWALMAGVAIDVAANTKLDIGYRYVNTGKFADGASSKDGVIHEYRAGLRYVLD